MTGHARALLHQLWRTSRFWACGATWMGLNYFVPPPNNMLPGTWLDAYPTLGWRPEIEAEAQRGLRELEHYLATADHEGLTDD